MSIAFKGVDTAELALLSVHVALLCHSVAHCSYQPLQQSRWHHQ